MKSNHEEYAPTSIKLRQSVTRTWRRWEHVRRYMKPSAKATRYRVAKRQEKEEKHEKILYNWNFNNYIFS